MNKLKPGDEIELKSRTVRHYINNLTLLYSKPNSGTFQKEYASEVLMFLSSYLKKSNRPKGKVVAYGAHLENGEKYLMIKVRNKLGVSDILAVEERDVVLLKKKK